jgi:hypothetical protein
VSSSSLFGKSHIIVNTGRIIQSMTKVINVFLIIRNRIYSQNQIQNTKIPKWDWELFRILKSASKGLFVIESPVKPRTCSNKK